MYAGGQCCFNLVPYHDPCVILHIQHHQEQCKHLCWPTQRVCSRAAARTYQRNTFKFSQVLFASLLDLRGPPRSIANKTCCYFFGLIFQAKSYTLVSMMSGLAWVNTVATPPFDGRPSPIWSHIVWICRAQQRTQLLYSVYSYWQAICFISLVSFPRFQ